MRDATIATSRTRATTEHLIDYRPLPAAWGDREALREVRTARARAAERGLDPSTLQITASSAPPARPAASSRRGRRGLFASLRREPGVHHRPRHGRGHLATT